MSFFLALLVVVAVLAGLSAIVALAWAVSNGQYRDLRAGAASIFDEDEPIGVVTDHFPGESPGGTGSPHGETSPGREDAGDASPRTRPEAPTDP